MKRNLEDLVSEIAVLTLRNFEYVLYFRKQQ